MMTNNLQIAQKTVEMALSNGAKKADVILSSASELSVNVRLGKTETIENSQSLELGLRVLCGGSDTQGYRQAIVSSNDLSERALTEMAKRAVDMAKSSPIDEYIDIASEDEIIQESDIVDLDLYDNKTQLDADQLLETANITEDAARKVSGVTNSEGAEASYSTSTSILAASNGFAKEVKSSMFGVSVAVVAGTGTDKEADYDYSMARHKDDLDDFVKLGSNAGMLAVRRLNPRKVKTCEVPIIFDKRVARSLLGSFASAINGSAIAKGTSFLKDRMDGKIFSDGVNIYDNPLIKRGIGSESFDAEAIKSRKKQIVENGELRSWLLDIRCANKLGLQTTGNAARGTSSAPYPSSSNLYMEAGDISLDDMIADVQNGFYLCEAFGMGINNVTGDYSQGAGGFWIENGKIAYPVSEVTIAGNMLDMFANIIPASDLEMKYGTNCPSLLVANMTVAGE